MTWTRGVIGGAGLAAIGYALAGAATDTGINPVGHLTFLATVLIGHDLILMPAAIGVGVLVTRYAPAWARGPVHAALYASAVLTFVALPFVIGAGRRPDNPSALPLPYGRGLLLLLAAVWVVAAIAAAHGRHRARRAASPASSGSMPRSRGRRRGTAHAQH
jgi:hypothetical protein